MKPALLALCLFSSAPSTFAAEFCERPPLVISRVEVWSPQGVARPRDVLVVEGEIREVTAARLKPPAGTRVIDGRGQVLLPGFIDAHLHFGFPGAKPEGAAAHAWGDAGVTGRQLLRSGVTAGRLHLDSLTWAKTLHDAAQDPCALLPRLQVSGPAFIPGSPTHDQWAVWGVADAADAAAKVRREHAQGFEWIAIHNAHDFGDAERAAIVDTARGLGMRILASGYSMAEVASSLRLHPDTIDYLDVSATPAYDAKLLDEARAQPQLVWVARLGVHERYRAQQRTPALIDSPLNYELVAADVAEFLRADIRRNTADSTSAHTKRMDEAYPTIRRKFEQLRASGIPLAMGTDAGSPGHFHRDAIWWEINAWVKNGASVNEALTAATVNGAKVLSDPRLGRVAPGAHADFLLYRGKLEPGALTPANVTMVVKAGVVVAP